jgi:tetratricopeptide (TPR) repeat protein
MGNIGDIGGDSETDRRIRELLDEGQRAHDNGDLQGAIDAWSRIFLIDIDHQEAARRIEQARKLKAEHERQAEEVFHEGVSKIEAGDLQGAKQAFLRVLEIQPAYFAAREYLQQLEAGKVPVIKPKPKETPTASALPMPSDLDLDTGTGELKEEILIPPDPSEVAAADRQRPKQKPKPIGAPAREGRARKLFVLVGSVVLVLALAGGAFVYLNRDRLFPNSQTDDASIAGPAITDPVARATELQKSGKTQSALSQLKRIPPSDPAYQRAQELIKEWSATAAPVPTPGAAATPTVAVAPPPVSPERMAILTAAREAYQGGSYLEAVRRLEQASSQGQLEPSDAEMLANARRQTEPLSAQLDLFRQHEWEHALRDLWRLHESEPANRDVTRLMVDSYYNLGLRDLQRMDSAKAVENFHEAMGLDPNDKGLQRQLAFAQTYQDRPKDLLYRIYVKHLPLR